MAAVGFSSGYGSPSYGGYGPPGGFGPSVGYSGGYGPGDYGLYGQVSEYGHPGPIVDYGPPVDYAPPPPPSSWSNGYGHPGDYGAGGYSYGAPAVYGSTPCYSSGYGSHSYGAYGSYGPGTEYGHAGGYSGAYAGHGYYGAPPGYGYYGAPVGYGGSYGPAGSYGSPQGPQGGPSAAAASSGRAPQEGSRKRVASRANREGGDARKCPKSSSSASGGRRVSSHGAAEVPPSDNLYVMGLPTGMANETLKQLFAAHGRVSQCRVLTNPSGEGKCAALVRFESLDEAKLVKEKLNGSVLDGLTEPVSVRFADPPETKTARASGEGRAAGKGCVVGAVGIEALASSFEGNGALPGGRGYEGSQHALYIAGLPPDTANIHLYKLFASFGAIRPKGVHAMMNPDGTCKGIAFVNFLDEAAAQAAIMMYNGAVLPDGTTLKVAMKQSKSDKSDAAKSIAPKSAASG